MERKTGYMNCHRRICMPQTGVGVVILMVVMQLQIISGNSCDHDLIKPRLTNSSANVFNASSYYTEYYTPDKALINGSSAWIPKGWQLQTPEYLQVNLGGRRVITSVLTQGMSGMTGFYVTKYKLALSLDGQRFELYRETGVEKVFDGNRDLSSIKHNHLGCPVIAKYIRFIPIAAERGAAFRVGVYGCNATRKNDAFTPFNMSDITIASIGHRSITIQWHAKTEPNLLYFQVRYSSVLSEVDKEVVFMPKNGSSSYIATLSPLTACTKYTISLLAFGRCTSILRGVTAQTTASLPAKPIFTSVSSPAPVVLKVSWKMPETKAPHCPINITSFVIRYKPAMDGNQLYYKVTVSSHMYTVLLTNLKSWTKYTLGLAAASKYGYSAYAFVNADVDGRAPEVPPSITEVSSRSPGSFTIKWKNPPENTINGQLMGFSIFYKEKESTSWTSDVPQNADNVVTIYNLTEKSTYEVYIMLFNNKYNISTNITEIYVIGRGPDMTLDLNVTSKEPNSIVMKWKKISQSKVDVKTCCLQVSWKKRSAGQDWQTRNISMVDIVSYVLKPLSPWMRHDVQVSLLANEERVFSDIKTVLVLGDLPGKPPEAISCVALSPNSILITWKEIPNQYIGGELFGYVVQVTSQRPPFRSLSVYTQDMNVTVHNLAAETEYSVEIAGYTMRGIGVKSFAQRVKTKREAPPPLAPQITELEALSSHSVRISWKSEEVQIVEFIIYITSEGGINMTKTYKVGPNVNPPYSLTIKDLLAYTEYKFRLQAVKRKYNKDISSDWSPMKSVKTKEGIPTKPLNLKVLQEDGTVVFYWDKPKDVNGILRKYLLTLREQAIGDGVSENPIPLTKDSTKYKVRNVRPYTNYTVELAAFTVQAGPSAQLNFTSAEGLPSEPVNVSAKVNGSKVFLEWRSPQKPHGRVTGYKVKYSGSKAYFQDFIDKQETFIPPETGTKTVLNVFPGTNYTLQIVAETSRGYGNESVPLMVMIPPQTPEPPPKPFVYAETVTESTITLHLMKPTFANGQLSALEVIIERQSRTRRSTASGLASIPNVIGDYKYAKQHGAKFYVTAKLDPAMLPMNFIVGDGQEYHGYYNAPLDPETKYSIHTRGISKDDNGGILYGKPTTVSLPTTAARKVPSSEKKSGWLVPMPIIVGVAGALLFLIILVVIIILYLRAGATNSNRTKHQYEMNDVEQEKLRPNSETGQPRQMSLTGDIPVHPAHPPIALTSFGKHVAKLHKNDSTGFSGEYNQLEMGKEFSWDVAHLPENKPKNRYANIVAYDHSRVVLSAIKDQPGSDYINASYVDGYMKPNAYVATQGPLPGTFNDFWRMVWELRTNVVVMLTNLQEKNKLKCHKYWPDDNVDYGDIKVSLHRREVYADYTIRTFCLQKSYDGVLESRQVKQFHFTVWPDHGVPDYATAILAFRRRVRAYAAPDTGPVVVHCSAGVGRTGTYIAIDSMLERLDKQENVDVFNFIAAMRTRRIAMVQTEEQYVFVHDAILEYLTCGNTQITAQDLRIAIRRLEQVNQDSRMTGFEKEWKVLNHASPILSKAEFQVALLTENVTKNRYSCVVPSDLGRVHLLPLEEDETTTYINAVYIDGYKQRNAFILTQCPLPNTVNDFWRMLSEHKSASVVLLCSLEEGEDYARFWPESGCHNYDMITVECLSSKRGDNSSEDVMRSEFRRAENELIMRKFRVTDSRDSDSQTVVKLFQYIGWTETRTPASCKAVISLVSLVEKWQQQSGNGPITIVCSDGLGRSGTFASLIAVLERVKVEQVVDVFQAIKAMRIQRPHLVKYLDQYKYIHYAVQEYLTAFDDYANFK